MINQPVAKSAITNSYTMRNNIKLKGKYLHPILNIHVLINIQSATAGLNIYSIRSLIVI